MKAELTPKEMSIRKLSENLDFIYWSEQHGFPRLADYFNHKLSDLLKLDGFNPRFYTELLDLSVKYGYQNQFEDFN